MAATRDYLGIQITGQETRVVALRSGKDSARVLSAAHLSAEEAKQPRAYRQLGARAAGSALALGLDQAAIRQVTLPPTTQENLDRIIGMEAEQVMPLPPEEICLGYHVVGMNEQSRLEVLLVAARQSYVQEALTQIQPPGAAPQATIQAVCLFNALCEDEAIQKDEEVAVVLIEPDAAELVLANNNRILWARPLSGGGDDRQQIESLGRQVQLSLAAHAQQTGKQLARLLLCGSQAAAAAEALAEATDAPTELWAPRALTEAELSLPEAAAFVTAYGAAVQAAGRGRAAINLTPARVTAERLQVQTRQATLSWGVLGASVVIAALVLGFTAVHQREQAARAAQQQAQQLQRQAAESDEQIIDERTAQLYDNLLIDVKRATQAPIPPSKMLATLMGELPRGVWLSSLTYNIRTGVRIDGYALARSDPRVAQTNLLRQDMFADVTLNYFREEMYEDLQVWAFELSCRPAGMMTAGRGIGRGR